MLLSKNLTWKSSNTAVATVDVNGKISAVEEGEATIIVTSEDGAKSATCEVTVTELVEKVTITPSGVLELMVADTKQLTATVTPEDAAEVTWSSDNEEIATVSSDGLVVARGSVFRKHNTPIFSQTHLGLHFRIEKRFAAI